MSCYFKLHEIIYSQLCVGHWEVTTVSEPQAVGSVPEHWSTTLFLSILYMDKRLMTSFTYKYIGAMHLMNTAYIWYMLSVQIMCITL